jgi:hypothetical protein
MNASRNLSKVIAAVCLTAWVASAASVKVTDIWTLPGLAAAAPSRVLVLAVLGNPVSRQAVEDEVVRQLTAAGVAAIAGYRLAPDTGDLPAARLAQALGESGAEAALVCRWHLVRQTTWARPSLIPGARPGRRVEQTAYGEVTLVDRQGLGKVWSAATTMKRITGFRDAAPEFAANLVGAVRDGGAVCRAAAGTVPRSGAVELAAAAPATAVRF